MKIKFLSDYDLPLNKTLEINNVVIVVGSVFNEGNKYYPQVYWEECFYKLQMLEYDMIDVFIGIAINKTNGSGKPNGLSRCFIYVTGTFLIF